jgi:hypothetical protein
MNYQPQEILCLILGFVDGLTLMKARRVNTEWKTLIETKVLFKEIRPTIEECIIEPNYYYFRTYFGSGFNIEHKKLMKLTENKIFQKFCCIDVRKNSTDRLLHKYSELGKLNVVKFLVEKGANIHYNNEHCTGTAAHYGYFDLVKYFYEKGADITAENGYIFYWAASQGHLEIVKFLLEKGIDIHINNDSALCLSAERGKLEVMKYLLEKGANVHAQNDWAFRFGLNGCKEFAEEWIRVNG